MFNMRQLVLDHQDDIARAIVAEHGKDYSDAIGEIQRGRRTLDFACSINTALKGNYSFDVSRGVDVHTIRQPVGVVAGICPFNFPVMVPMWMHPIALATGNAFILNRQPQRRRLRSSSHVSTKKPACQTDSSTCSPEVAPPLPESSNTQESTPSPS